METMKQSGPWSILGYHDFLKDGYVFLVVKKLEILRLKVKFDLEGKGQSPNKTIGILTRVFYTFDPHMVILAWMGHELSQGQAIYTPTDTHKFFWPLEIIGEGSPTNDPADVPHPKKGLLYLSNIPVKLQNDWNKTSSMLGQSVITGPHIPEGTILKIRQNWKIWEFYKNLSLLSSNLVKSPTVSNFKSLT